MRDGEVGKGEVGKVLDVLVWVLIGVGVVYRVGRFAMNRSLWLDEIFLANNLIHKTWAGLLGPLDYRQGAPPLFLMAEKLAITVLGPSEMAMRLVSLVGGIAALLLMRAVARRLLGRQAAVVAVALLVFAEPAIYYSAEVKQYSTDLMTTLGVLWVGLWYHERPDARRAAGLAVVGVVAIYLSHPAVFVLAAVGGALLAHGAYRGERVVLRRTALAVGTWGVAFVPDYLWFLRPLGHDAGLLHHWADGFMPWSTTAGPWVAGAVMAVFSDYATLWMRWPMLGFLVALLGVAVLARRRVALIVLVGPGLVVLAAAALHQYPFSGRLLLFLVPTAILLMAAAFVEPKDRRLVAGQVVLLGLLIAGLVHKPISHGREEIRDVLRDLSAEARAGDVVYVAHGAHAGYAYYRERYPLPAGVSTVNGHDPDDDPEAYAKDLAELPRGGRVWLLFSHTPTGDSADRRMTTLIGREPAERVERRGAGAYLYEGLVGGGK
jgi:uncharacterized membrane protein